MTNKSSKYPKDLLLTEAVFETKRPMMRTKLLHLLELAGGNEVATVLTRRDLGWEWTPAGNKNYIILSGRHLSKASVQELTNESYSTLLVSSGYRISSHQFKQRQVWNENGLKDWAPSWWLLDKLTFGPRKLELIQLVDPQVTQDLFFGSIRLLYTGCPLKYGRIYWISVAGDVLTKCASFPPRSKNIVPWKMSQKKQHSITTYLFKPLSLRHMGLV